MWRRELRDADLPKPRLCRFRLRFVEALSQLATVAEPEMEPREIVPRVVTAQQIDVPAGRSRPRGQGGPAGHSCRGDSDRAVVTPMAALELVRRREMRAKQTTLFGPIILEPGRKAGA